MNIHFEKNAWCRDSFMLENMKKKKKILEKFSLY